MVASAEGISEQTLRNWLAKAKTDGTSASDFERPADKWSTQDKFLIVVETASMNEEARQTAVLARKAFYVGSDQVLARCVPECHWRCRKRSRPFAQGTQGYRAGKP